MVLKEVPGWARKCIVIGLLLPMLGFFMLKDYNSNVGVMQNVIEQDIVIPFLWGQSPIFCMSEDVQRTINSSFGFSGRMSSSFDCQSNTRVPYRFILCLSMFMVILGVYMFAKGNQIANIWPTEWKPFDEANVRKRESSDIKIANSDDKPVNPKKGGF